MATESVNWKTDFAWMIERGSAQSPEYWAGGLAWSYAHGCGIRFCRKIDAERAARAIEGPDSMRVAEHGFSQRDEN